MHCKHLPNFKPLVLLIAASFPLFASAAPAIKANGSFEWGEANANDATPLPQEYGNFTQAFVSTPFNKFANTTNSSAVNYQGTIATNAYSDGTGHFGTSIVNTVPLGPSFYVQKAQTQVVLSDSITNTSSSAQNVSFDININSLSLNFRSGMIFYGQNYYYQNIPVNSASFAASILANGNTIWSSSFSANPVENGLNWNQNGTEIGLSAVASGTVCNSFYECSVSITNYHQSINLGPLAANDSLTVSYQIDLQTETNTYGGAPSIYFDDPAGLSGNPTAPLSASLHFAAAPVPEPETASMLAAGLALLGAVATRRRRKTI